MRTSEVHPESSGDELGLLSKMNEESHDTSSMGDAVTDDTTATATATATAAQNIDLDHLRDTAWSSPGGFQTFAVRRAVWPHLVSAPQRLLSETPTDAKGVLKKDQRQQQQQQQQQMFREWKKWIQAVSWSKYENYGNGDESNIQNRHRQQHLAESSSPRHRQTELSSTSTKHVSFEEDVLRKEELCMIWKLMQHLHRTYPDIPLHEGIPNQLAVLSIIVDSPSLTSLMSLQLLPHHWQIRNGSQRLTIYNLFLKILQQWDPELAKQFQGEDAYVSILQLSTPTKFISTKARKSNNDDTDSICDCILNWIMHWMANSNSISCPSTVFRLWDVLLASAPHTIIYFAASLCVHFRESIIQATQVPIRHAILSRLPLSLPSCIETVLTDCRKAMKLYPLDFSWKNGCDFGNTCIPSWTYAKTVPSNSEILNILRRRREHFVLTMRSSLPNNNHDDREPINSISSPSSDILKTIQQKLQHEGERRRHLVERIKAKRNLSASRPDHVDEEHSDTLSPLPYDGIRTPPLASTYSSVMDSAVSATIMNSRGLLPKTASPMILLDSAGENFSGNTYGGGNASQASTPCSTPESFTKVVLPSTKLVVTRLLPTEKWNTIKSSSIKDDVDNNKCKTANWLIIIKLLLFSVLFLAVLRGRDFFPDLHPIKSTSDRQMIKFNQVIENENDNDHQSKLTEIQTSSSRALQVFIENKPPLGINDQIDVDSVIHLNLTDASLEDDEVSVRCSRDWDDMDFFPWKETLHPTNISFMSTASQNVSQPQTLDLSFEIESVENITSSQNKVRFGLNETYQKVLAVTNSSINYIGYGVQGLGRRMNDVQNVGTRTFKHSVVKHCDSTRRKIINKADFTKELLLQRHNIANDHVHNFVVLAFHLFGTRTHDVVNRVRIGRSNIHRTMQKNTKLLREKSNNGVRLLRRTGKTGVARSIRLSNEMQTTARFRIESSRRAFSLRRHQSIQIVNGVGRKTKASIRSSIFTVAQGIQASGLVLFTYWRHFLLAVQTGAHLAMLFTNSTLNLMGDSAQVSLSTFDQTKKSIFRAIVGLSNRLLCEANSLSLHSITIAQHATNTTLNILGDSAKDINSHFCYGQTKLLSQMSTFLSKTGRGLDYSSEKATQVTNSTLNIAGQSLKNIQRRSLQSRTIVVSTANLYRSLLLCKLVSMKTNWHHRANAFSQSTKRTLKAFRRSTLSSTKKQIESLVEVLRVLNKAKRIAKQRMIDMGQKSLVTSTHAVVYSKALVYDGLLLYLVAFRRYAIMSNRTFDTIALTIEDGIETTKHVLLQGILHLGDMIESFITSPFVVFGIEMILHVVDLMEAFVNKMVHFPNIVTMDVLAAMSYMKSNIYLSRPSLHPTFIKSNTTQLEEGMQSKGTEFDTSTVYLKSAQSEERDFDNVLAEFAPESSYNKNQPTLSRIDERKALKATAPVKLNQARIDGMGAARQTVSSVLAKSVTRLQNKFKVRSENIRAGSANLGSSVPFKNLFEER